MALPPVCAGGVLHYMLLISLAVLQTALNVSCSEHRDSVSIMRADSISAGGEAKEGELSTGRQKCGQ